jgi:hypothetical protein
MSANDYPTGPDGLTSKAGLCAYLGCGETFLDGKIKRGEIDPPDVILGPRMKRWSPGARAKIIRDHQVAPEGK